MGEAERRWLAIGPDDDDHYYARSCQRKRRYPDRAEALRSRQNMSESNLKVYFCKFCNGWHLGRHGQRDATFAEDHRRAKERRRKGKRGAYEST